MKLVFDQMAILSGLLWVFLLIALGLTACEPGPATEADIQPNEGRRCLRGR